jgi:predicted nucleic-acid-binding protein
MSLVDANVILRYLLDDHPELSTAAAVILEQEIVTLTIEVACEVVFVLQKVYAVDREEIRQQLSNLLNENLVTMEKPTVFLKALECYSKSKFGFVDCLLWAYHTVDQQTILTFDNKLQKLIQRKDTE